MSTGLKRVEQRPVVAFWSGKDGQRPSPTVSTTKACLRVSRISLTSASVVTNSGTVPGEAIEKALYGDGSARFAAVGLTRRVDRRPVTERLVERERRFLLAPSHDDPATT